MSASLPEIHDGDLVEVEFDGEAFQGVAILDRASHRSPVLLVEIPGVGVVVPDQRFPVLLLEAAGEAS